VPLRKGEGLASAEAEPRLDQRRLRMAVHDVTVGKGRRFR